MTDKQDLLTSLRAIRSEMFPYRDSTHWEPHDDILTLGVHLERQILLRLPIKTLPKAYAEGAEPQPSARPKRRPSQ
jgi:hypothetical protein